MGSKPFTTAGVLLFALVALAHLYRLFTHFQVIFGNHRIPLWASWVGLIVPAVLAVGMWREAKR
jgi:hypothetical protein